jgi:hypothetical protein
MLGCASVKHQPVADFEDPKGIPYYGGSHYLLVYSDGKGNIHSEILYLMDRRKKMVADPTSCFASLQSTLSFTNGVLSDAKAVGDATAIPQAILAAAEKVLAAGVLAAPEARGGPGFTLPAPSIYKIVVESPTRVRFVGEETDEVVHVNVTESEERAR